MQGYSVTSAPSSRSCPARLPLRSAGRVITTRFPFRGRRSNQSKRSDRPQTLPTTMMAGLLMQALRAASGSFSRVETTFRWLGRVPRSTTAAGMDGSIPASSSPRQIIGREVTPIRKTSVPPVRRSASKSM